MPSASTAKVVKQASAEAVDPPIKQGIVILDHKIRNLEKRKSKLEGYRDLQAKGKSITAEQCTAVAKFNEVVQTLKFASDLREQFNGISLENARQLKKQARKEAVERQAADLALIKHVLTVQSVLLNFGSDSVRNAFLAGDNGACKLTEEELKLFDDFHYAVTIKSQADGGAPIDQQLNAAAELFQHVIEGKTKQFSGSTYAALKEKLKNVHGCGYFDNVPKSSENETQESPEKAEGGAETGEEAAAVVVAHVEPVDASAAAPASAVPPASAAPPASAPPPASAASPANTIPVDPPEVVPQDPAVVLATTFHSQTGLASQPVPHVPAHMGAPPQPAPAPVDGNSFFSTPPHPALRAHDVITQVSSGGSFHFLQDSELDSPDMTGPGSAPHHVVQPIPSQTYTNPNFPSPVNPPPASAVPMYQHHTQAQPPVLTAQHHHVVPEAYSTTTSAPAGIAIPPNPPVIGYQQLYVQPSSEQRFDDRIGEGERAEEAHGRVEQPQTSTATTTAVSTAPTTAPQQTQQPASQQQGATDWAHQVDTSDWNAQTESEYNLTSHSDGYRTQRGSGGGSRDRTDRGDQSNHGMRGGRKGHRGGQYSDYSGNRNRDGYQGGNRSGGGGYERSSGYNTYRSGDGNTVYQNGFNKDGSGGGYRSNRPPRDGDRPPSNRGGGGMNRGGPRGPPRGGNPRGRGPMRAGGPGGPGGPKQ